MNTHIVARMRAYEAGQAQRLSSTRNIPISPAACILIPIAMAGEDPALFALGVADKRGKLEVLACPNPTNRDHTYAMLKQFADAMHPFIEQWHSAAGGAPQIVCQSDKAVSLMLSVFHRMMRAQEGHAHTDAIRVVGRVLQYFDNRYKREESVASLSAPAAVMTLYATGQDPPADAHLGALMEWFKPADGKIIQRVQAAERLTVSTATDPADDRAIIEPLYERFHKAEKNDNRMSASQAAQRMKRYFTEEIQRRLDLVRAALRVVESVPETAYAAQLAAAEKNKFSEHAAYALVNVAVRIGFKGPSGTKEFIDRDLRHQEHLLQCLAVNGAERAEARITGKVLCGIVTDLSVTKQSRSTIVLMSISTEQDRTPLRAGQQLRLLDSPTNLEFSILEINSDTKGGLHASLQMKAGMRSPDVWPDKGDYVELGQCPVFSRKGIHAWERLHNVQARPALSAITPPRADYVSLVKQLEG